MDTKKILNQASKCKPTELENLLNRIQTNIEQSPDKKIDPDISRAKTIITSRLASMRSN